MDENKLKQLSDEYKLSPAVPQKIPKPTYWPVFLAFGITLLLWGFTTTMIISILGLIVIGFAVFGWIMDLRP